jgi:hypothetical protein
LSQAIVKLGDVLPLLPLGEHLGEVVWSVVEEEVEEAVVGGLRIGCDVVLGFRSRYKGLLRG